ncbi:tRNA (adenosine(37)-N6)-threonylcarbamoyltransferase complex ATPase subunit type 1 TsaE [Candidatus Nomurabacteria bacterium]|nr:tRNA (adenosine(37)-N6)-threonylcarbamoyltransferase complex ATPase subunit type 1 TsaE [Candidatus Nomurabacteria bacterium]
MQTYTSHSLDDTNRIAGEILEKLVASMQHHRATVCALSGNLGAGKTALTKTLAHHLDISETVISPTFVLAKFYQITNSRFPWKQLIHIDAYRLTSWQELAILKFDEIFSDPRNLIMIEWPEQVADRDQKDWLKIRILQHGDDREIIFEE